MIFKVVQTCHQIYHEVGAALAFFRANNIFLTPGPEMLNFLRSITKEQSASISEITLQLHSSNKFALGMECDLDRLYKSPDIASLDILISRCVNMRSIHLILEFRLGNILNFLDQDSLLKLMCLKQLESGSVRGKMARRDRFFSIDDVCYWAKPLKEW